MPIGQRLGDLLVAEGLIDDEQLKTALDEQKRTGDRLGTIVVRLGYISEEQLVHFLSLQYRLPVLSPSGLVVDPDVLGLVPVEMAVKHQVIPVQRSGGSLTLAMADPTNLSALDDVAFRTGLQVVAAVASPSAIRRAIEQLYNFAPPIPPDALTQAETELGDIEVVEESETAGRVDLLELRTWADEAPVVRLVNTILLTGIHRGSSDIHLEPFRRTLHVRYRIDGVLHQVMTLPKRIEPGIVTRIKIMAGLDIAERRLPQDGRLKVRYNTREVDFRIATLPTPAGESVTMRVLDKESLKLDLTQLGFGIRNLEQFQKAIQSPTGMILITGPTGSGKTTTLYSAIHALRRPGIKIITVEDPVEYELDGIIQVEANEQIGRTFASTLRSMLRHDPDAILVGEMRDLETAQIAVRAALTGHLVLSTLHTNDCPSTITRLLDMGIPPLLVASTLRLVVAQRLARKVCQNCKEAYEVDAASLVPYGYVPQGRGPCVLSRGKGCPVCNATGMKGRIGIYEVMSVTQQLCDLIVRNGYASAIRELAREQGMKTLREAGLAAVLEGVSSIEEIVRVTSE